MLQTCTRERMKLRIAEHTFISKQLSVLVLLAQANAQLQKYVVGLVICQRQVRSLAAFFDHPKNSISMVAPTDTNFIIDPKKIWSGR